MKNLKEWNEDIGHTKMDMYNWAIGNQGSWQSQAIFLAILAVLLITCLIFHWKIMTRVIGLLTGFQVFRIIKQQIVNWRESRRRRGL